MTITNYTEYMQMIREKQRIAKETTIEMLLNGRPAEAQSEIDEIEKAIYDFEHSHPFAVFTLSELGAKYYSIGRYMTAEEAIANCPEYDSYVANTVTYEEIYRAEDHPNRHTW